MLTTTAQRTNPIDCLTFDTRADSLVLHLRPFRSSTFNRISQLTSEYTKRQPELARYPGRWLVRAICLLLAVPASLACGDSFFDDYWLPDPNSYCAGEYQVPTVESDDVPEGQVRLLADRTERVAHDEGTLINAYGAVSFEYSGGRLTTDQVKYWREQNRLDVPGQLNLSTPQGALRGQSALIDAKGSNARIDGAEFVFFDAGIRGTAERVRVSPSTATITKGSFTRCPVGSNAWRLSANEIEIEQENNDLIVRGVVLRIKDVPVLYLPRLWLGADQTRRSGVLQPSLNRNSRDGFEIEVPLYLNLAPNYDATIAPGVKTQRGASLNVEFRHINQSSWMDVDGFYLTSDRQFDGALSRDAYDSLKSDEPFDPVDRWKIEVQQRGKYGPWFSTLDFTDTSDSTFYQDLGSYSGRSGTPLIQTIGQLSYQSRRASAEFRLFGYKPLSQTAEQRNRQPELSIQWSDRLNRVSYTVLSSWARFDDHLTAQRSDEDWSRLHLEPSIQIPVRLGFGILDLSAGLRHTRYEGLPVGHESDVATRQTGYGSLDFSTLLERDVPLRGREIVQTLKPRLFYVRESYEDQSALPMVDGAELGTRFSGLFDSHRFVGLDRIPDRHTITLGMTSEYLSKSSGRLLARVGVGAMHWIDESRLLQDGAAFFSVPPRDVVAGELFVPWSEQLSLQMEAFWNPQEGVDYANATRHVPD